MFCFSVDVAIQFFELPSRVQSQGNFFIIRSWIGESAWILFICTPLCCESFPRTPLPSSLTVCVLTNKTFLSDASQFPNFRFSLIKQMMGISKLLKLLYFGELLLGFIHLESLQLRDTLSASSSLRKLLGLPVSAIQSFSMLLDVVRIHILSDSLWENLAGFLFSNVFGLTKLTVLQLSKISWMKKVFSVCVRVGVLIPGGCNLSICCFSYVS